MIPIWWVTLSIAQPAILVPRSKRMIQFIAARGSEQGRNRREMARSRVAAASLRPPVSPPCNPP
jgi:hypothetical protein